MTHAEGYAQVDDMAKYQRYTMQSGMPKEVILYQYEVCPFCNKVRAFLDYHKVKLSLPFGITKLS